MDLRVKKTKRAIRNAFLELAKEKPAEKITVKELAERAEINKATFYGHYQDIYALIEELEEEAVDTIVSQMLGVPDLLENPREFIRNLAQSLSSSSVQLYHVSSLPMKEFGKKLYDRLHEVAKTKNLDPKLHEESGLLMAFIIQGMLGVQNTVPNLTQRHLHVIEDLVAEGVESMDLQEKKLYR